MGGLVGLGGRMGGWLGGVGGLVCVAGGGATARGPSLRHQWWFTSAALARPAACTACQGGRGQPTSAPRYVPTPSDESVRARCSRKWPRAAREPRPPAAAYCAVPLGVACPSQAPACALRKGSGFRRRRWQGQWHGQGQGLPGARLLAPGGAELPAGRLAGAAHEPWVRPALPRRCPVPARVIRVGAANCSRVLLRVANERGLSIDCGPRPYQQAAQC